jgi:long-chain acyl-CoA synthetase
MMDYRSCPNLAAMFFAEAARQGDRPFLWAKSAGTYHALSWQTARQQVAELAKGLRALGIGNGDRVVLVAENRPEWVIADFAIMSAGAITVPAYTTHTVDDYVHVMTNCAAKAVIVSSAALAQRVLPATAQAPSVATVLTIEPAAVATPPRIAVQSWAAALARGAAAPDRIEDSIDAIRRDDVACLIYTSGTGGAPKGVMMTHGNILANCHSAFALLEKLGLGHEVFLSFLPLSHSYEHTAGMMFPISLGAEIYFAEGAETLAANLLEARPTIMTAVPRLYEAFHQRILHGVARAGGIKAKLFHRTLALGLKRIDRPDGLGWIERAADAALDALVRRKFQARFGGRLKAMVSGGAALNPEIGRFFLALGLRLLQGYGQTEAAPVISANPPDHIKIDTVGPPVLGVEVGFAADGEILVRGDNVMKGYWNDAEATARALDGGWLHTGDVGRLDDEGFLVITDRKKDFIKTSGGEMVAPARIEFSLTLQPEIGQAMVAGDRQSYLVAVLVPSQHLIDTVATRDNASETPIADRPEIRQAIAAAVARANQTLAPFERIRRFIVTGEPFTTANHQMTPTLKIRRHVVRQVYADAIAALYEKPAG